MPVDKYEIPPAEWQFLEDLGAQNQKDPNKFLNYQTIQTKEGHISNLAIQASQIQVLPLSLGNLSELRLLNISNNNITKMPHTISNLTKLEEIILDNQVPIELPSSIYLLKDNRSVDHGRRLTLSFTRSNTNFSTVQTIGDLLIYAGALHHDRADEVINNIYHPDGVKQQSNRNSYLHKISFYKSG